MLYKCKECGGELQFDPTLQKLKCPFCDSVYELDEYDGSNDQGTVTESKGLEAESPSADPDDVLKESSSPTAEFVCPHCGARMMAEANTSAMNCLFCNTPMVIGQALSDEYRPDYVIPFEIDQSKIPEIYERYIKNKPFYPREYSKASVINRIRPIYLPFWLYDMRGHGSVNATGEHTMTYSSGNYIVTKHSVFDIERNGIMDFTRVPVSAAKQTPKDAAQSMEPYDCAKLQPFNEGYLPGFMAQRFDMDDGQCWPESENRAKNTLKNQLISDMAGYEAVSVRGMDFNLSPLSASYALMPAYLLVMDYDANDDRVIAINGQTGKIVGNIPVDKGKKNRYFIRHLILFLVLFIALALILCMIF